MASDSPRLLLIVTGSTLRAEEMDRPLAYYLRQQVEKAIAADPPKAPPVSFDDESGDWKVLVVADFRWINEDPLHAHPTISVGGPGVNALANRWFEELPFALAVDEQYCIQMDPDLALPRVSIWGMDNASTQIAVSLFLDRYLPRFLDRCATYRPDSDD